MNLIIDIGNTNTKFTIYKNSKEVFFSAVSNPLKEINTIFKNYREINHCILSASGYVEGALLELLSDKLPSFLHFNQKTPLPFTSEYETPETIGLDRLAAVAGVFSIHKNENVLIIDAGTAITYDIIRSDNVHLGGNISPGLEIRFKALNTFTDKLPLLNKNEQLTLIGRGTDEAIRNGVINGIIYEIEGTISKLEENYKNLTVLLTGGDAHFFDNKVKKTIFVVHNLVSTGLNTILNYNVSNH